VAPDPKVDRQTPAFAGQAPHRGGHKACGLFMAREHKNDRRILQRIEKIQSFLTGDPKHIVHN
jgi:hypothetical protein